MGENRVYQSIETLDSEKMVVSVRRKENKSENKFSNYLLKASTVMGRNVGDLSF